VQTCGADGTYGEGAENLKCLRTCASVPELQTDTLMVSLQRLLANKIRDASIVVEGDTVTFRCSRDGFAFNAGASELTATCTDSGKYDRPLPKCLAKCGDPIPADSLSELSVRVTSSGEAAVWERQQVFEGDIIEFSCASGSVYGVEKLLCGDDGMYHPYDNPVVGLKTPETPTCRAQCAVPRTPRGTELVGTLPKKPVLEDAQLHYSCSPGCAMLGESQITCTSTGVFDNDPPRCKCAVTLRLNRMEFEGVTMDEVNVIKLKLFPRSVGSNGKTYDKNSYKKLAPKDFHDLDLTLDHDLDSTFFHVELCDSSVGNWFTLHKSRCEQIAVSADPLKDSGECPLCFGNVVQQVELASSDMEAYKLVLPITGKGVGKNGFVNLFLSYPESDAVE